MPDCVLGVTAELAPFTLKEKAYDLIVLGYQAWFLYPSIPVNSLLHHPDFRAVLKNTPVVTITGARNMWLNTFLEVKKSLHQAEARLVGNIALVDKHPNHISFVTIFHWLLRGKKDRYLNIFPFPGVSAADIAHTAEYGSLLLPHSANRAVGWPAGRIDPAKSSQHEISFTTAGIQGDTNLCGMGQFYCEKEKKAAVAGRIQILSAIFTVCCCACYPCRRCGIDQAIFV